MWYSRWHSKLVLAAVLAALGLVPIAQAKFRLSDRSELRMPRRLQGDGTRVAARQGDVPDGPGRYAFDGSRLRSACGDGRCVAGVRLALRQARRAGGAPDALNTQIALIAAVLLDVALGFEGDDYSQFSRGLMVLSRASRDAAQKRSLAALARRLLDAGVAGLDLGVPVAASPS